MKIYRRLINHANRVLVLQMIVGSLTVIFWCYTSVAAGVSALFGVIAWVVPSIIFVGKLRKAARANMGVSMLSGFYVAELMKWLVSVALIILMLQLYAVESWPFLCGYVSTVMSVYLAPMIFRMRALV